MPKKAENKIQRIKDELNHVPSKPGCYLWKDKDGQVIYVGKAKNLRARMRQYVNLSDDREKIPLLVEDIESFDYIVVKNESESLILEKNLINQYKPFYNADFKDDKSYPFIAITEGDMFPAIKYTREKHVSTTRYFGPYTESRAARQTVDIVRRIVPICITSCVAWKKLNRNLPGDNTRFSKAGISPGPNTRFSEAGISPGSNTRFSKAGISPGSNTRFAKAGISPGSNTRFSEKIASSGPGVESKPCFDCTVGLGPGACCDKISPEDYMKNVKAVERFLNGNQREFIDKMENEMKNAATNLDFERADRIKKRIDIVNRLTEKQHIVSQQNLNCDVLAFFREETITGAYVLIVREGRVINSNEFILNKGQDVPNQDLIHNFLLRYYDTTTSIPKRIIMREKPEDEPEMSNWLTKKLDSSHGAKVKFEAPKIGEKMDMLKMAELNAKHSLMRYKVRTGYDDKRINDALLQLESALAMEKTPMRIECYDISTIHGSYTVASMVTFSGGKPDKNSYRRYKIKTPLNEANDFASMQEVLRRRFDAKRRNDKRFAQMPDLILLDGGKPQLTAAKKIFKEIGFDYNAEGVALAGLAKSDEELIVPFDDEYETVVLPDGSASLYLVKQVRDEAHRFAITFHRQLRAKGMTASILDEVPGLGPVRKKALLKAFGSFKKLKEASLEEIKSKKVIPIDIADELFLILHNN